QSPCYNTAPRPQRGLLHPLSPLQRALFCRLGTLFPAPSSRDDLAAHPHGDQSPCYNTAPHPQRGLLQALSIR
ncbi:MAG: hypothetical protein WAZ19_08650, partial [Anaerolineae bacterium]